MTVKQNGAYHKLHAAISAEDAHLANHLLSALEFKQALKKKGNQVYLVTLNHLENPDGSPIKATSHLVGKPLSAKWQARLKDIVDRYQDVISPDPNLKPDFPPERAVDHIIEKIPGVEITQRMWDAWDKMSTLSLENSWLISLIGDISRLALQPTLHPS
jgi:hypothetical protein